MIIRNQKENDFYALEPTSILDAIEAQTGGRATGRAFALNSLENRVYEIELEDGNSVVAKFYRPGRWTREQIQEEHDFLLALKKEEVPVIAPIEGKNGTLAETEQEILFTVFPKVRGRLTDELSKTQLEILGRYLARIHNVGRGMTFKHRMPLNPETFGEQPTKFLLDNGFIDLTYERKYKETVDKILAFLRPAFKKVEKQIVHGDCHLGNVLWDGDSPFFLDFDDCTIAPRVQDVWMVVTGRGTEADQDREHLLAGYNQMGKFPRETLHLFEGLRALRMIHYSAWIGKRWNDPAFQRTFPDFTDPRWWEEEIRQLEEVLRLLHS